jgi:hypothetical protein
MVGTGCLEKLLKVISRLSRLAFEVALGGGDELLIGIIGILVVVSLITLVVTVTRWVTAWGPLVDFGAPLCTLAGCLEWRPSTSTGGLTSRHPGRK